MMDFITFSIKIHSQPSNHEFDIKIDVWLKVWDFTQHLQSLSSWVNFEDFHDFLPKVKVWWTHGEIHQWSNFFIKPAFWLSIQLSSSKSIIAFEDFINSELPTYLFRVKILRFLQNPCLSPQTQVFLKKSSPTPKSWLLIKEVSLMFWTSKSSKDWTFTLWTLKSSFLHSATSKSKFEFPSPKVGSYHFPTNPSCWVPKSWVSQLSSRSSKSHRNLPKRVKWDFHVREATLPFEEVKTSNIEPRL